MLVYFKYLLTVIGSRLSSRRLLQIQAPVNYLKIGYWMRVHGYSINQGKRAAIQASLYGHDNGSLLF